MKFFRAALFLVAAVLALASLSFASGKITGVHGLTSISRLTGTPSLNNTTSPYYIGGTDLGIPIYHNDRMYFLFGDTFSGEDTTVGGNWRRNTVSWSTDTTLANGILFDDWAVYPATDQAKQTFTNNVPTNVITNIPTGGIDINGTMYAWFMNVIQWGPANGEWYISQAELGKWNDTTNSFELVSNSLFAGDGNFGMVAAREGVNGDPYIYLWGTPAGRFGNVKLARFLPSQIETRSAYQFYDGMVNGVPQWTSDEFAADYIITGTVGEMSVMYNQALGAWTILYFNENNDRVEIRQSDTPWGPWSSPVRVMAAWQCPSGTSGPYAPYMHPRWVENNGETIYFTLSLWTPYDVYLTKVTLNMDTAPVGSVSINGGAAYTKSSSVTLTLPATDNSGVVSQMRITNDGVFDTESWQAYTATKSWILPPGEGTKTVYVRYRDTSNNESATFTDTIILHTSPPAISLPSVAPTMVAKGDLVHVVVNATDPVGVASVKADLTTDLIKTGSTTWEGDVTAGDAGEYSIRIDAADVVGNTSTYSATGYVALPVVAASARSFLSPIMTNASTRYLFRVYGKVTIVSPSAFDLNDGSGVVRVNAPGYNGIANNDYATAIGILTPGADPSIAAQAAKVEKLID